MSADHARRMDDALGRVVARGHDVTGFFEATGSVLRRSIPFDGFCSMTVDPATMLLTSHIAHDSVRPQDVPALGRNEFLEDDVNKFAVLARAPRPAGVLTQATAGQPESSPRFREILRPNGFADELRFTLLDGDECWGWVALYRREGSGRFDDAEATLAAGASQLLAEGLRRAILLEVAPGDEGPDAPGLILLTAGGEIEAVTPPAERWLAALITSEAAEGKLPPVVNNVAYRALLAARGDPATGAARARVPTNGGGWLAIHGSVLGDPADGRIAIILEPAKAPEMAPLIVAAYGLSPREREVTELVLHGLSTTEIAQRLHVSAYTVQDHLKAIFDKVTVRSRRELVARIFSEHYMPRLQSGMRPGAAGWFAEPPGPGAHEAPTNESPYRGH